MFIYHKRSRLILKDCIVRRYFLTRGGSSKQKDYKSAYSEAIKGNVQILVRSMVQI